MLLFKLLKDLKASGQIGVTASDFAVRIYSLIQILLKSMKII